MLFKKQHIYIYIYWVLPPPSNSHHQDYYMFNRESQPKPSFATGILGGANHPIYIYISNSGISFDATWIPSHHDVGCNKIFSPSIKPSPLSISKRHSRCYPSFWGLRRGKWVKGWERDETLRKWHSLWLGGLGLTEIKPLIFRNFNFKELEIRKSTP